MHYHKDTFAYAKKKSHNTKSDTIYKSKANMPFLVVGISGTNLGFFSWTMFRVGKPHKTDPTRPVFSLLDVVSFKEADACVPVPDPAPPEGKGATPPGNDEADVYAPWIHNPWQTYLKHRAVANSVIVEALEKL